MRTALAAVLMALMMAGCAARGKEKHVRIATDDHPAADQAGAVLSNIFYVPGRALICGASGVLAFVTIAVTFGQEYEGASDVVHGGCSGPWILTREDVR